MRHDEFSITIGWRKPNDGAWPRPDVEGFYLTMGWANDGQAEWLVDRRLVAPTQVVHWVRVIASDLGIPSERTAVLNSIPLKAEEQRRQRVRILRAQREAIDKELEVIEDA